MRIPGAAPLAALAFFGALCLAAALVRAETGQFPFSSLRITGVGEFAVTDAGMPGSGYALAQRTREIRADKGVAFGVEFALEGGVFGKSVLVEARLSRPVPDDAVEEILAPDRWFIPAKIGQTARAVYLLGQDAAPPGTWTLELFYAGEMIGETRFDLRPAPASEATGEAARPNPETPPAPASPLPAKAAPAPAAPVSPKAHDASRAKAMFTVQTGVFSSRENALGQAAALRAMGLSPRILKDGEGASSRYRVLVGEYAQKSQALLRRKKLMTSGKMDAVVKLFPASRLDKAFTP